MDIRIDGSKENAEIYLPGSAVRILYSTTLQPSLPEKSEK